MKFTFYGHACFSVESNGKNILFDPFIKGNELAQNINIDSIKADYILLSHGHADHIADAAAIAGNTGATIIGPYEVIGWLQQQGVKKVHPMNFGTARFDFGDLHFVPAWHSSTMPDGTPGGSPGGFVLSETEKKFYYSGDTCLMMDMQLIPRYATLDFAVLPIGGNFTMNAREAVMAADFIKCDKIIGIHYDTFGYIKIDQEAAKEEFRKAGKELILLEIGQTIEI
jgi:L-ascorbate metabolism protein UlaG (beta-lactamase superfamily)